MRLIRTSLLLAAFAEVSLVLPSDCQGQTNVSGGLPVSSSSNPVPRKLAEGVLTIVPPNPQPEETSLGPIDLDLVKQHPELAWSAPDFPENAPFFSSGSETLLEKSRNVVLRHPVFALEFAFKPVRMIQMESGEGPAKLVWYMIYRVRYLGNDLHPNLSEGDEGIPVPDEPTRKVSDSVVFVPRFSLIATQSKKEIPEKIIPAVKNLIAARERVGKPLLDSVEIMRRIPKSTAGVSNEFWGLATWTNIDPSTDFFAVHVEGLTNAYRIKETAEGRTFEKKVLQIHFWRPGDSIDPTKDVIRLGVPAFEQEERVKYALDQFGLEQRLDYKWIYR